MIKHLSRTSTLICCLLTAGALAFPQEAKFPEKQRLPVEAAVAKFMAESKVPGMSVAVVEDGRLVWAKGFGFSDLEDQAHATEATLFRLASVSKPLTAVGAMELWEKGKLDLDAPIQKYCPAFPEKPWPITTRQLLGHLSGIRHYHTDVENDPELMNTRYFDSVVAGMAFFANDPLLFQPGTKMQYTTHGYTVVGCVIEGASHQKYMDYMRDAVFAPAGMTHTQQDVLTSVIPNRTRFYAKNKAGAVENAGLLDSSYKVPGGGLISSAEDIARFEAAMLNDRLVQRKTRDLMWTSMKLADGKESGYGAGFGTTPKGGLATIGHSGSQQGTSTAVLMAPEQRTGVVVLTNMESVDAMGLATTLLKLVVPAH